MQESLRLIIETSTSAGSLVLAGNHGELHTRRDFSSDRSHNAMLFQPLEELMALLQNRPIDLVLVGSGPGSYSGTRVGIAAAQGVAIACGCPAIAVPSILAVPCVENSGLSLAIGDARRGGYWTAEITDFALVSPPTLTDATGLAEKAADALAKGGRIFTFEETGKFPLDESVKHQILPETPDAERLWNAWQQAAPHQKEEWSAVIPQPIYLKPPHITPGKKPAWL